MEISVIFHVSSLTSVLIELMRYFLVSWEDVITENGIFPFDRDNESIKKMIR